MKRNKYLINEYSAAAGVFILFSNISDAQVIYVDLEPDVVFDFGEVNFDIDNNGTQDFRILKETFYTFDSYFFSAHLLRIWEVGTSYTGNSIIGIPTQIAFTLYTGFLINESALFNTGFFNMAGKRQEVSYTSALPIGPWTYHSGLWNEIPDEDRYLGIKFIDEAACIHYGWMRCSFTDSVETIHIKDYAYNAECGTGLYAGELISGINETQNEIGAVVYSFNKIIYLHLNEITELQLIISDITGKELLKDELLIDNDKIDMQNYPTGIYLVSLLIDGNRFDKKVFIE